MKIFVSGAAGFIGSNLVELLANNNFLVKAVDCFLPDSYDPAVKRRNWNELKKYPNVELIEFDLRNSLPMTMLRDVDVIVNEAAMPGLMKSWSDFTLYSSSNINLVENLARNAMRNNVSHFIQISTSSVYGANALVTEEAITQPISPYGVTKLAAEELLKTYSRTFGLNFTILRYFSVYGPRQRPDMAYHKLIRAIWEGTKFEIFGDGMQTRSNTFVEDCIDATSKSITTGPVNEVINIAGAERKTLLEAINIIEQALERDANIMYKDPRPGD